MPKKLALILHYKNLCILVLYSCRDDNICCLEWNRSQAISLKWPTDRGWRARTLLNQEGQSSFLEHWWWWLGADLDKAVEPRQGSKVAYKSTSKSGTQMFDSKQVIGVKKYGRHPISSSNTLATLANHSTLFYALGTPSFPMHCEKVQEKPSLLPYRELGIPNLLDLVGPASHRCWRWPVDLPVYVLESLDYMMGPRWFVVAANMWTRWVISYFKRIPG